MVYCHPAIEGLKISMVDVKGNMYWWDEDRDSVVEGMFKFQQHFQLNLNTIFAVRIFYAKEVDGFLAGAGTHLQLCCKGEPGEKGNTWSVLRTGLRTATRFASPSARPLSCSACFRCYAELAMVDFVVSVYNIIATSHASPNVYIWEVQLSLAKVKGKVRPSWQHRLGGHEGGSPRMVFNDTYAHLLTLDKEHTLRVFCTRTFTAIQILKSQVSGRPFARALLPLPVSASLLALSECCTGLSSDHDRPAADRRGLRRRNGQQVARAPHHQRWVPRWAPPRPVARG